MDLRNLFFLLQVCLCTILGCQVFDFKTKQNENDVFLNFRGEDTRYGIISHLDEALSRRKIKTFIDEVLPRGEDVASLLKEIQQSRVAVVVFSEDYASSQWCLDELVRITECRGILEMKVLPIFYGINSSDVSNQNGSFQAAFDRHEEDFKDKLHKVQRWRAALMEVSRTDDLHSTDDGLHSRRFGHENDLVKEAVDKVAKLLRDRRSEKETLAGRAHALFCIFLPVVILLYYKNFWLHLFYGDFRYSVSATAIILFVVLLGFWFHDQLVYLCTLESYYDVLAFGMLSNHRSSSEISEVVILILIIWSSRIVWSNYFSNEEEREADQFNNSGSNAQGDDEDSAENSQSTTVITPQQ